MSNSTATWCAAACLCLCTAAQAAADNEHSDGDKLEEITVTAQRRTERLQDVPISATVVSGAQLEQLNVRSLADLAGRQPNFQIAEGAGADQIFIRGTGSGANSGFEQSVATFVDDLYRSRSRDVRVALFDVDRIEVLKGPQTTYFGANAIAGALNITTRKPTADFESNADALYSPTDGEYNIEGGVSGPVTSTLNLRVAGRGSGMSGYIDNQKLGGTGPDNKDGQARIAANWRPLEALTVDARFDYARTRDHQTFDAQALDCPTRSGVNGTNCALALANYGQDNTHLTYNSEASESFSRLDLYEGGVTGRLDLGGLSVVSTSGYLKQTFDGLNDLIPVAGPSPIGTLAIGAGSVREEFGQFSQELRLESAGDSPLQYMAGAYFERYVSDTGAVLASYSSSPSLGSLPFMQAVGYNATTRVAYDRFDNQSSNTISGFGSLHYALTSQLSVNAGLRYSDVVKHGNLYVLYGTAGDVPSIESFVAGNAAQQAAILRIFHNNANYARPRVSDNGSMPSANLEYHLTPDAMAYLSYTRGFKAGGFSGSSNNIFNPEKVDAYEGGVKSTAFGGRLQTNLAVFLSNYDDLQETQYVVLPGQLTSSSVVTNAAKSRAKGVEFGTRVLVTRGFTLSADAAYLDSRFLSYANAPCYSGQTVAQGCTASSQDLSDRTLPYASKWSGTLGAEYATPFIYGMNLRMGTDINFKSQYYILGTLEPASRQAGFAKLDARIALATDDEHWEFSVIGRNLLDKTTYAFFDDTPLNVGTHTAIPDRPRSVALSVSYRH
jgi:iron complex outermembrane recepter protein